MKIPARLNLDDIQEAFHDVYRQLRLKVPYTLHGQQIVGAAEATLADGLVTLSQLERATAKTLSIVNAPFTGESGIVSFPLWQAYLDSDDAGNPIDYNTIVTGEELDDEAFTLDSGKVVCQRAGRYIVFLQIAHNAGSPDSIVDLEFQLNGVSIWKVHQTETGGNDYNNFLVDVMDLVEDNELRVTQTAGSAVVYRGGIDRCRIGLLELPTGLE